MIPGTAMRFCLEKKKVNGRATKAATDAEKLCASILAHEREERTADCAMEAIMRDLCVVYRAQWVPLGS